MPMRFTQPRYWKQLERHPESAEYPDIKGKAWEQFVADMREYGILDNRKVTLHEDKVIDAWQFYRACVECDIRPQFEPLKLNGMPLDKWMEIRNERRRDETQEVKEARAARRRKKVEELREEGKSTREIAEEVGVSHTTIQEDIKAISTGKGCQLTPKDGTVTGKDGKKRKPKSSKPPKPEPVKDDTDGNGTLLDQVEFPVPTGLVPTFNKVKEFKSIVNQLNEINRNLETLSKSPAGACMRLQQAQVDLRNLKETVRFDTPHAVCPVCKGSAKTRKANCPCKQRGWLVEVAYLNLPSEFRA
jgi:hypothetical protein